MFAFVSLQVVRLRELRAPYLLPVNAFDQTLDDTISYHIPKECLFSQETIVNALDASGYDTSRFDREFRPEPLGKSWIIIAGIVH